MLFESEAEALAWYEKQEPILTKEFVNSIPWHEIKHHPLDPSFFSILTHMRDVECLTEVYYQEAMQTPTAKEPAIRGFMDRWKEEEAKHGNLINRFVNEAGFATPETWFDQVKANIPNAYRREQRLSRFIARLVGKRFSAVHMTWGAIQEFSTLSTYQRMWEVAKHPVLEYLFRAIAREEARHAFFYWSMARIKLLKSKFSQSLSRFLVKTFWTPVGQGPKTEVDTNRVIAFLFGGEEGVERMDQRVNQQLERLPGMAGLKTVTERIAQIGSAGGRNREAGA